MTAPSPSQLLFLPVPWELNHSHIFLAFSLLPANLVSLCSLQICQWKAR